MSIRSMRSLIFCAVLALPGFPSAQAPAAAQAPEARPIPDLRILVLDGQGAFNNLETEMATIPVVEVRDSNDRPLEGAEVTFELPSSGPSAFFPQNQLRLATRTNYQGQAAAAGLKPNNTAGKFDIRVTATFGNRVGSTLITQFNSTRPQPVEVQRKRGRRWWILGLAATGGVVTGIVLNSAAGSDSTPQVSLVPGPVTIGGSR